MRDEVGASWVLMVGAAAIGYWWWRQPRTQQEAILGPLGGGDGSPTGVGARGGAFGGAGAADGVSSGGAAPLDRLLGFVQSEGLPAPSPNQTTGGVHVPGSLHYQGRAIDVGVAGLSPARIAQIVQDAIGQGFRVLQELYTGNGPYGPSSGPHLHIEDRS